MKLIKKCSLLYMLGKNKIYLDFDDERINEFMGDIDFSSVKMNSKIFSDYKNLYIYLIAENDAALIDSDGWATLGTVMTYDMNRTIGFEKLPIYVLIEGVGDKNELLTELRTHFF